VKVEKGKSVMDGGLRAMTAFSADENQRLRRRMRLSKLMSQLSKGPVSGPLMEIFSLGRTSGRGR
jgi:hypothetical protein